MIIKIIIKIAIILLLATAILATPISCFAETYLHSGGTDSQGGHYDHSTGEYHYHHGKPAHDHINGVCPNDTLSNIVCKIIIFVVLGGTIFLVIYSIILDRKKE